MSTFHVTRAHLKTALDQAQWDLLDKLLELDNALINDNALYTDTWGEWWGLLLEATKNNQVPGVRVLLKHGAQRDLASWGDCLPCTPAEAAHDKPEILALLQNPTPPTYTRQTDPPLPQGATPVEQALNRQGAIRDATGLVFQTGAFDESEAS